MSVNQLVPAQKPTRRLRGVFYAGTLLLCGGVIGAVVVGPTLGQAPGPQAPQAQAPDAQGPGPQQDGPRWRRGWNQGDQGEGPRWRRHWGGDQQSQGDEQGGRRGWGEGRRRFGEGNDDGMRHGRGERMLYPGAIERRVNRVLGAVDASTEQRQKVRAIFEAAANDLYPMRQKRMENRKQIGETLAAATIDRAKLEQLRADRMKLADDTSRRMTAALADAAEVLTAQRADLATRMERWRGGRGG